MPKPARKAVFPVGGWGTRFLPATKVLPKEMLPVVDKPVIQYAFEEARAAGIEEFIFVAGPGKQAIRDHFAANPALNKVLEARGETALLAEVRASEADPGRISFALQEEPLGLGHAVWCARDHVGDEPFAVILADDMVLSKTPCLTQLAEAYAEVGGNIVAVMEVPREQTRRYGILDVESDDGRLAVIRGLVEKPEPEAAPSTLSIIGRYILQPEIFEHLARGERGVGGEIQLTDAMARMIGTGPFHGLRFEGVRYDCGNKVEFLAANVAYALAREDLAGAVRDRLGALLAR